MIVTVAEKLAEVVGIIALHSAAERIVTDRRALKAALSHSVVYRSRRLRVSMAQILSIKVEDKFILLQSARRPERVTPIGGAVRFFSSAIATIEGTLGFKPEFRTGAERYDLRGYLLGRNLVPFLRWYTTGAGREHYALAREIEEEFIEVGIRTISGRVRRPEFAKDRDVHEGPTLVKNRDYWQYRFFEVLSLQEEAGTSKRLADFIRKEALRNNKFALVSTDEMRQGRLTDGRVIGDSAGYLFSESTEGIAAPPLV